ncbi:MAG TPA: glycerophosphodiester phosphodiesterase [Gemmatimonadaceae bacterium]|nr:glycerophosphodiester phosphodiesterase [Gemmatimonadaceae bacterium]
MLRAHRAQSYYPEEILTRRPPGRPQRIAHRGAHDTAPENSIPAFERAIALGADAIELDVHATSDGVVIVHHDAAVHFPGLPAAEIAELTAADLARYRLDKEIAIPTLPEVLSAIGRRASVYIEIKAGSIEPLVVRCIRESEADCAVHSFDHRIVKTVKSIFPAVPTGVLQVARPIDPVHALVAAGARDLWQEVSAIDEELVSRAHSVDARVIAWTANDVDRWETLRRIGVDGICTDRIRELGALD